MKSQFGIILSREYFERVKRKSFIITTLLMPIIMGALMILPGLITAFSGPQEQVIAVIDDSNVVAPHLQNEGEVKFVPVTGEMADLKANEDYDAILVVSSQAVSAPNDNIALYTRGAMSIPTEQYITSQLERAIEDERIKQYDIDNFRDILQEIQVNISLSTFRMDKDEESASSSILSYLLGLVMMLVLYMFIMLYGQMVMTSIIEEKNNRVLELVVSSVKPTDLMLGKILGIGAVAFTQILIWSVILMAFSLWVIPSIAVMAASGEANTSIMSALATLGDPAYMLKMLLFLLIFLVGGYLFYSSIYAAIGSAVDNIQDASQIQAIAIAPILIAFMVSMAVVNDPNSVLAEWTSWIPFTSPMVMMARMPFDVPLWQSILSAVILYVSFIGMIWVAAKIYRVGIFMYGKKPTIGELIRWTRYK